MLNKSIPYCIYRRLWGDRKRFDIKPDVNDPDWRVWLEKGYSDFYQNTQQKGIGAWVCKLAYPVISKVDFHKKSILEIGPGRIRHLRFMRSAPQIYEVCDTEEKCLSMSKKVLENAGINNATTLLNSSKKPYLPFSNTNFDIIISFNTLEHFNLLDEYLKEFQRILKPGGKLVGGIPCEGGLAWGLGRYLTTRRYVYRKYRINYDKIICWEHPNFADFIIEKLDKQFERQFLKLHPFHWLPIDFNLVASFVFIRR